MKNLILAAASATAMLALSACGDAAEEPLDETTVVETDVIDEPLPADSALDAEVDPALDPALDPAADPLATDPALDPAAEPTAEEEAPAM